MQMQKLNYLFLGQRMALKMKPYEQNLITYDIAQTLIALRTQTKDYLVVS